MLKLAELFQNDMILQRRKPVRIWGTSDSEVSVSVTINNIGVGVFDLPTGDFSIELPPQEAMENANIEFKIDGNRELSLTGVDFGEIWIAGGQSNMEFYMRWDANGQDFIATHTDEHIRHYEVGRFCFEGHRQEGTKDVSHSFKWMKLGPDTTQYFSAVGTYFAHELRDKLNIPIGIIACNWCGSTARAWLDRTILENDPDLRVYVDDYKKGLEQLDLSKYHDKMKAARQKEFKKGPADFEKLHGTLATKPASQLTKFVRSIGNQPLGPEEPNRPGCLYEYMVKEIAGFACAGVIWYQGETDAGHADIYDKLFGAMIDNWRRDFKDELPFFYVQLAPFEQWLNCYGNDFPKLRQAQARAEKQLQNVYMVSIMDAGERYDIHPKNKVVPAHRLALKALKYMYNVAVQCEEPEIEDVIFKPEAIEVVFKNAAGGLECDYGFNELFDIRVDGNLISYNEKIVDNTIVITSDEYKADSKVEIAFAYRDYLKMDLYNRAGLAARPMEWRSNGL